MPQRNSQQTPADPWIDLDPLPPSTTSSTILHFVSSTSRFLNEFVAAVDYRLESITSRIETAEAQMTLLEAKLEFVKEDKNENDHDTKKQNVKIDSESESRK